MTEINLDMTYTESIRLICAFKKHSVLWNPHISGYHNRDTKEEAWKVVAAESGFLPGLCKKKMKSLLSSCRREKNRILKSKAHGDQIVPKWRYWNAFKFLRGVDEDEEDPLGTAPEMDILDPTATPAWLKNKMGNKRKKMEPKMEPIQEPHIENQVITSPQVEGHSQSIGVTVASKLRKMYHDQRLYAENLINQTLYKGMLSQLTKQSEIRTPIPATQIASAPTTSSVITTNFKQKEPAYLNSSMSDTSVEDQTEDANSLSIDSNSQSSECYPRL